MEFGDEFNMRDNEMTSNWLLNMSFERIWAVKINHSRMLSDLITLWRKLSNSKHLEPFKVTASFKPGAKVTKIVGIFSTNWVIPISWVGYDLTVII